MADTKIIEVKLSDETSQGGGSDGGSTTPADNQQAIDRSNQIQKDIEDWYKNNSYGQGDSAGWTPPAPDGLPPGSGDDKSSPDLGSFDTASIDSADLDKTIEALKLEFEGLSSAAQAAAQAGTASASSSSGLASAAAAAAGALAGGGGSGGGGGGVIKGAAGAAGMGGMGGGLALAALSAAAVLIELGAAGLAFNKVVDKLVEEMGQLSGEVQAAVARGEVMKVQDDLRAAREVGGTLANLQDTRNEIASDFRGIMRESVELFGPLFNGLGMLVETGLNVVEQSMIVINDGIDALGEGIDYLTDIGDGQLTEAQKIERNTRPEITVLDENPSFLDAMFNAENIGFTGVDMNLPDIGDPAI